MKAVVIDGYGTPDVLRVDEVATPVPGDDQVLVAVKASSLNPYDWHVFTGLPRVMRLSMGLRKPKNRILGADFAGVIEAVGSGVTDWAVGDAVYSQKAGGAYAEYVTIDQKWLATKPTTLTFEQAATVPLAGVTAIQAIRDRAAVVPGTRILINGASGGVGTFAVQIAAALGADVTGVCSTRNVEMVRSLGADHVIDYTADDYADGTRHWDVVFDLIGNRSVSANRRALTPRGRYVAGHGQPENLWLGPIGYLMRMKILGLFTRKRLASFLSRQSPEDLAVLTRMIEGGSVTPVIDRSYPLDDVQDAFRYLESWHARGKVVITL